MRAPGRRPRAVTSTRRSRATGEKAAAGGRFRTRELDGLAAAAWDGYNHHRKAPLTRKAGPDFADPNCDLAVDWIAAQEAVKAAQARHYDPAGLSRFLLIACSARSEHTCPGEMSKSYRLVQIASEVFAGADDVETEILDLSRLTSEDGRHIHPCKAGFSTAPALCHWPCSC